MPIELDVLVLPAFADLAGLPGEHDPWLERYDLDATTVSGVPGPLHYGEGLGIVPTGIGKCAAATTTTALFASDAVDVSDALVLSVGVAGGPPSEVTVGSVVLSEYVVDWDDKVRWAEEGGAGIETNPYTGNAGVYEVDPDLVSRAHDLAAGVELADKAAVAEHRNMFEEPTARGDPELVVGTNVCGDELWHGGPIAADVTEFVATREAGTYCATEMEDAGTVRALERLDHRGGYLPVRGISNFDRQPPGRSVEDHFFGEDFEAGVPLALENAVRVASVVVDDRLQ
jgi:purine nucleoside permease